MERKPNNFITFLIGAAVGATVAYLLSNGKAEHIIEDLKDGANKMKDELDKQVVKGKELIDDLKSKAEDVIKQSQS
jgi:gas vesicle protein